MEFVLDNAAVTLSTVRTLTGTTKLLHWSLTDMVAMRNQFPDPERLGRINQVPRREVPLVRLRGEEEGPELAPERDGLRSSVPQSQRPGAHVAQEAQFEVEGMHPRACSRDTDVGNIPRHLRVRESGVSG